MDHAELLSALERDGTAFLAACLAAPPDTTIEACPDHLPADLLWHLLEVHWFWRSIVERRAQEPDVVGALDRPPGDQLPTLYRSGVARLVDVLRDADPATPVWTWSSQNDVAFVIRRMAQETAMHRWDADHAAQRPAGIEAELASDGIDEFLMHMLRRAGDGASLGGSVHLHCTDVAGEWMVRQGPAGFETTREHAKGDCALRGTAEALLLALWRRAGTSSIEVVGNADLAMWFLALTPLD